jgi:hypothetical protein
MSQRHFDGGRAEPSGADGASGIELAVNGTLMRGFELNDRLVAAGGRFVRSTSTAACYLLYSIDDEYPAMVRDDSGGAIEVEVWRLSPVGLIEVLAAEPPGLCIGRISLADGNTVLGVLGEPWVCKEAADITAHGGWRGYVNRVDAT